MVCCHAAVNGTVLWTIDLAAFFGLLFTALPEASASEPAGASGWEVNGSINNPLAWFRWKRGESESRASMSGTGRVNG